MKHSIKRSKYGHSQSRLMIMMASGVALLLVGIVTSPAVPDPKQSLLGEEITLLFLSARAVISQNQELINDSSKGDKGVTPEFVVTMTKENYTMIAGKDFKMSDSSTKLGTAQKTMFSAVREVIELAQPIINEKGKGYKGFLPAVFAKQVATSFSKKSAGSMSIKLTAPKSYIRNSTNSPDSWESEVIETKFKSSIWIKGQWFAENAIVEGRAAYRFILPEYYKQSCLKCHGEPKGELDITGGKKEGGVLGELGGAISFAVYE